ncbi:sensor histidine kinase [Kineococcus sp. SYSU DK002]|uniref:sensor histidine kinase n=1 Tax=Kineococcus sp. SYSU DK002 TaxID=3383123 RepID=UPI003D7E5578
MISWWRRAGVRVRSTVAATALMGVLLLAGSGLGLVLLRSALLAVDAESGGVQARLVRLSVTAEALGGRPDAALRAAVGADADRGSHVQVLAQDGSVVVASAALAGRGALTSLRPATSELVRETVDLPQLGRPGPWVVSVAGASVEGRRFWVVAAESTADAQRVLGVAAAALGVGSAVVVASVALLTWTFVGRSLRPVEAIRSTVQGISSRGLDGRVPVPAGEDEVARLAVTMNGMLARLEAAQRAQRRFVADASHELRSPVATLSAAAQVWSRAGGVDRGFTELVGSESARLEALVGDLLLLARADEGRLAAGPVGEVDLDEVVEVEAARVRAVSGLPVAVSTVPVRVLGDAAALARVVRNLVDNAVRHAGSAVELAVGPEVVDGASWAVVTVADDGAGIPVADRERVLGRFVRLDDSRQRGAGGPGGPGGTGLGLAIVAEVVAAHAGRVVVGERAGGGASVRVLLPVGPAEGPAAGPGQPPSAASR